MIPTIFGLSAVTLVFAWFLCLGSHREGVFQFWLWHHLYVGTIVFIIGAAWWPLLPVGALIALDDGWQHLRQIENPAYESPLHRVFGWFYERSEIVRRTTHFLDSIMESLLG